MWNAPPSASKLEELPGFTRRRQTTSAMIFDCRSVLVMCLVVSFFQPAETCLPSWFRQERASEPEALDGDAVSDSSKEMLTNSIIDDATDGAPVNASEPPSNSVESDVAKVNSGSYEEEEVEDIRYYVRTLPTTTLSPEMQAERDRICRHYCQNNGLCDIQFHPRIWGYEPVPFCKCPENWHGRQCEDPYFRNTFEAVKSPYSVKSSALPAFAMLFFMLAMFVTLVVYAYKRMASRPEDSSTYAMSHTCPSDVFNAWKSPSLRTMAISSRRPASRQPSRANARFFARLAGSMPSSVNRDAMPQQYGKMPRVEISAIGQTGHIDLSALSYSFKEQRKDLTPPTRMVAIEMEALESSRERRFVSVRSETTSECPTRASSAPNLGCKSFS